MKVVSRSEIKQDAKKSLSDNWGLAIVSLLIALLIKAVLLNLLVLPMFLLDGVITLGVSLIFINIIRNNIRDISQLFAFCTNGKRFVEGVLWGIMTNLFLFLWSLLFIVPGVIKSYSYSMSRFIMIDDPEITALDAITKSRYMMDGYKWKLFVLDLSFIGWWILSSCTLGIGSFYTVPYYNATLAKFYDAIKDQQTSEEV